MKMFILSSIAGALLASQAAMAVTLTVKEADVVNKIREVSLNSVRLKGGQATILADAKGISVYTFDLDTPTGKILAVRGLRKAWGPRPVHIVRHDSTWLARPELAGARLANAFYVEDIPYSWKPGVLEDEM